MSAGPRLSTPELLLELEEHIEDLDISADGAHVAVASVSGQVAVAGLATSSATVGPSASDATIRRHDAEAVRVRWAPDGQRLAAAGNDGVLAIHAADGALIGEVQGRGWCGDLEWRPDGGEVAVAFGRSVLRVGADAALLRSHGPLPVAVACVAWRPEVAELAVAAGADVWWYGGDDSAEPLRQFQGSGSSLVLAVSPDGRWLAVGNQDSSVHCWQLVGDPDELAMSGFATKVSQLSWSPDALLLAVGNLGRISVWDFAGLGPKGADPRELGAHDGRTTCLAFSPTATAAYPLLASGGSDGIVRLLVADGARTAPVSEVAVPGIPSVLRWAPAADAVVVGCEDGSVVTVRVVGD